MLRRSSFSPRYVDDVIAATVVPLFTSQTLTDWGSFGGGDALDQSSTPISPGGTSRWIQHTFDGGTSHWRYAPASGVMLGSGQVVTASIHLLDGTNHFLTFMAASFTDGNSWYSITVNMTTGAITQTQQGSSATLTASHSHANGSGGGYRFDMTGSYPATDMYLILQPEASGTPTISSNGYDSGFTNAGATYSFWGAEVDPGSIAQPYSGH